MLFVYYFDSKCLLSIMNNLSSMHSLQQESPAEYDLLRSKILNSTSGHWSVLPLTSHNFLHNDVSPLYLLLLKDCLCLVILFLPSLLVIPMYSWVWLFSMSGSLARYTMSFALQLPSKGHCWFLHEQLRSSLLFISGFSFLRLRPVMSCPMFG